MKITDIHIDGFGVWHDLTLRGLSPELTVFYGPNEAGKSTLMNFLRTVLYGVTPQRRKRYLPPLAGGRPGGSLKVLGEHGPFKITRYADRSPDDVGKVTIITADGQEQGDRLLLRLARARRRADVRQHFRGGPPRSAGAQFAQRHGRRPVALPAHVRPRPRVALRRDPDAGPIADAALELGGRAVGDSRARHEARSACTASSTSWW